MSDLIRVLVIEDDFRSAQLLQDMLRAMRGSKFRVEHEDTLQTGLERLSNGEIDVVLLDLNLSDSQGIDTFIKVYTHAPQVPIIVLTGFDDEGLALETMRHGGQDYLIKGNLDRNLLTRAIRYAIERNHLLAKLADLAVLEERQRLARELHDSVSQTLFSAGVIADTLLLTYDRDPVEVKKGLKELSELTRGARAEMRGLLAALRPANIVDTELGDSLRQLVQNVASRSELDIRLTAEGKSKLPPDVQITFYRITQEALNNAVNHSGAKHVDVQLQIAQDRVELYVNDDGGGFDPLNVPSGHLGLKIMHERASSIGGSLHIASQPQIGTQIYAQWPNPEAVKK